jgi:hypothetical protein
MTPKQTPQTSKRASRLRGSGRFGEWSEPSSFDRGARIVFANLPDGVKVALSAGEGARLLVEVGDQQFVFHGERVTAPVSSSAADLTDEELEALGAEAGSKAFLAASAAGLSVAYLENGELKFAPPDKVAPRAADET